MSDDVESAKADIERTRAELQDTVDQLSDRLDPRVRASEAGEAVKAKAQQGAASARGAVEGREPVVIGVAVTTVALLVLLVVRRRKAS